MKIITCSADEYRTRYIAYMVRLGVDEKLAADDYDNGDQPDWNYEPEDSAAESMSYWEESWMCFNGD